MTRWGIRQESEKHKAERAERDMVCRLVRERDRGQCQARERGAPGRCGGHLDVHEVIPRSVWRKGYLVIENCVLVCRSHHEWIEDNAEKDGPAHTLGLHGFSWER